MLRISRIIQIALSIFILWHPGALCWFSSLLTSWPCSCVSQGHVFEGLFHMCRFVNLNPRMSVNACTLAAESILFMLMARFPEHGTRCFRTVGTSRRIAVPEEEEPYHLNFTHAPFGPRVAMGVALSVLVVAGVLFHYSSPQRHVLPALDPRLECKDVPTMTNFDLTRCACLLIRRGMFSQIFFVTTEQLVA